MNNYPIHCYSLNRPTSFQDMDEYRLPCSLDDALKFLALFLTQLLIHPKQNRYHSNRPKVSRFTFFTATKAVTVFSENEPAVNLEVYTLQ
jgi:hypothetical protein